MGKTTLARIFGASFNAQFLPVSAVFSGVKDIREAIDKPIACNRDARSICLLMKSTASTRRSRTRFLPPCRKRFADLYRRDYGKPSFEVNPALLSRAQVYVLQSLSSDDLKKLIAKVLALPEYWDSRLKPMRRSCSSIPPTVMRADC